MKKIFVIFLALVSALLITEFITGTIVHYPKFGVDKKLYGIIRYDISQNIYKPFAEYWTVEGGNNVFHKNNLGLPGIDVNVNENSKYLYVLGSSYVESNPINPESIATSLFQKKIEKTDKQFKVINIGASGHDPYDSYFRTLYFEKKYKPEYVIYIFDDVYKLYFKRHKHPLDFELPKNFAETDFSVATKLNIFLRNSSSLVNMVAQSIKELPVNEKSANTENPAFYEDKNNYAYEIPDDLFICIEKYHQKYEGKFICLSIVPDKDANSKFASFCADRNIKFASSEINTPENKINGIGHLNTNGNKLLGEFIYESFEKFNKE